MVDLVYRPLGTDWTEPEGPTEETRFRASWADTKELMLYEAERLGADRVIVQLDIREADLRQDGEIRAKVKASSPRVRVTLETRERGSLVFATDRFRRVWNQGDAWQENLRAIALGLAALRAVDRYGITTSGEQYVGWQALPVSSASREAAAALLAGLSDGDAEVILTDGAALTSAYRQAAIATHPDRGGSEEAFADVQAALALLRGI